MKTLQNNFTTPEQSNRLLELGVPADSADIILRKGKKSSIWYKEFNNYNVSSYEEVKQLLLKSFDNQIELLPCWSVGRLMEIFDICNLYELHKDSTRDWSVNIKNLMLDYEVAAEENMLDFSKLED